ncbi:hypothetical protein HYQ46_004503 [Verticillium longisporum]|nr:hypothetical protein HYQ46_004503 [Verticillium longisporum]
MSVVYRWRARGRLTVRPRCGLAPAIQHLPPDSNERPARAPTLPPSNQLEFAWPLSKPFTPCDAAPAPPHTTGRLGSSVISQLSLASSISTTLLCTLP